MGDGDDHRDAPASREVDARSPSPSIPSLEDVEASSLLEEFGNKLATMQTMLKSGCLLTVPHEALFDAYSYDWVHSQMQLLDKQIRNMDSQAQLAVLEGEQLQAEIAAAHERMLHLRQRRQHAIESKLQVEETKKARVEALRTMQSVTLPDSEAQLRQLLDQVQAGVSPQARQSWRQVARGR